MQNGHKNNVIPVNAPVIPANAGTHTERHARFPSPSIGERHRPLPSPLMGEGHGEGEHGGNRANSNERPKVDVEAARKSMARMANIFADIAQHAEDSSHHPMPLQRRPIPLHRQIRLPQPTLHQKPPKSNQSAQPETAT